MFTALRNLLIAAPVALVMAAMCGTVMAERLPEEAFSQDVFSQKVMDAHQESQIWTTFALNPYLRANELSVTVHLGKAVLTGKVEEGVERELAKQIALGVTGIKDVDNQIVVQADYVPVHSASERSYGEFIDDVTVTALVKSKLLWSRYTDGLAIEVETRSGKVTLNGTADSVAAKQLAGRLAMNTRGVMAVDNRLFVDSTGPTRSDLAKASVHDAKRDIADSWISTKVKSTYLYSNNVEGANIVVTTRSGVVTLTGKVNSRAERDEAILLAQNVGGVKRVQSKDLRF